MEIRTIESFLPYFETIRERTLRVIRAVPAEKLEWRHADGVFSCGDLARHVAAVGRYTFTENVVGRPSRYSGCGPKLANGHKEVVAFMERMHRESIDILQHLKPEDLAGK